MKRLFFILSTILLIVSCAGQENASRKTEEPKPEPTSIPVPEIKKPNAINIQELDLQDGLYAKIETTKGEILIQLEYQKAPLTVINFAGLAEGALDATEGKKYYDGLTFHRVIADFMIQGGDPTGTGSGGPGYRFPDEIHPDLKHDGPGILSMANAGPGTNGSQFFITHRATPHLDGKHTVFGRVIEGQNIVDAIEQGDTMDSITIIRQGADAEAFEISQGAFNDAAGSLDARVKEAQKAVLAEQYAVIEEKFPNAQVDDNGIYYMIEQEGSGDTPSQNSTVTVHYEGSFLTGQVFDSTARTGQPAEFSLGQVIPGFSLSLAQMKVGEKRTVVIPPELGYGAQGYPGAIPPNAFLIFKLELVDFK